MENLNIKTNSAGQRFLFIDDYDKYISSINELSEDQFDAFYLDMEKGRPHLHTKMMHAIRTSYNGLLYLYPVYAPIWVDDRIVKKMDNSLFDGFVNSIEDEKLIQKTADILNIIRSYKSVEYSQFSRSTEVCAIQLLRMNYSRSFDIIPNLDEKSYYGYSRPLIKLFAKNKIVDEQRLYDTLNKLVKEGHLESSFVDKVHLCEKCNSVHLLYRETCVKCGSANLRSGKMIHHFVCANVAPEEDYLIDNHLICPKCHRELRHIGVDYDRPSDLFNCNVCATSFLHPKMIAQCMHCGHENELNKLIPHAVMSYKLTGKTYEYIKDPNIVEIENAKKVPGFFSFDAFIEQIKIQINFIEEKSSNGFLHVFGVKTKVFNSKGHEVKKDLESEVISFIAKTITEDIHPEFQILSFRSNIFYNLLINVPKEEMMARWVRDKETILVAVKKEFGLGIELDLDPIIFTYKKGDKQEDFIVNVLNIE